MEIYLVQHGEAKPEQQDPERGLTVKGRSDVLKVAGFLKRSHRVQAAAILHSGKTRARQTAEYLAEDLCPGLEIQQAEGLGPMDPPELWAGKLAETSDPLMLVGHLPHLNKLATHLLKGSPDPGIVAFQMGGVVCLSRNEAGAWALTWMLVPDLLPDSD
ncbi:MAG: phosphohistidine phosphatase SixA [Candidatus Sericytochromatia bacterium]